MLFVLHERSVSASLCQGLPLTDLGSDLWSSEPQLLKQEFLAAVLNDSGIAMPATMAGVYLPFLLYALLHLDTERIGAGESVVANGTSAHFPIAATTSR